jgi:hypothetical protein
MSLKSSGSGAVSGLMADFRLLLILFISFRLLLTIAYQPLVVQGVERGLSAGGDFQYYFQLGALSERGLLPFRDWWSEFPPIPAWVNTIVYQLAGRGDRYSGFALLYGLLMLAADVGNLIRIRQIGIKLYGGQPGTALAWIYALMIAPTVFIWWNFEPLVAFLLLSALHAFLLKRDGVSSFWALIGMLTKFTPALLIGTALRFRPVRAGFRYTGVVLGGFIAVYLLLFAQNAAMTLPSLTAQFSKPSYQTVWALLDGNFTTGNFGPVEARLDPDTVNTSTGQPAVIPGWLRLSAALAIGALIFATTRRFDARGQVYFTTLALLVFFVQAQGWSPQWLAQIIPLLLLCFPTRNGVLIAVLLSGLTFVEYPFLFIRTGDSGGIITGALVMPFVVLVSARTLLLIGICAALYQKLRQEPLQVTA